MKTFKKIGLWRVFSVVLFVMSLAVIYGKGSPVVYAATTPFPVNPFSNSSYTMQDGRITTTIRTTVAGGTQPLTFSSTGAQPLSFKSDAQIFCNGVAPTPSQPAKITMPAKPWGASVNAQLDVSYYSTAGNSCNRGASGSITIKNLDAAGSTTRPDTISTTDGIPYFLVDPSQGLYGLNQEKGSDCYGGSVMIVNGNSTQGTLYSDLTFDSNANTSLKSLTKVIAQSHPSTGLLNLIQGCVFNAGASTTGTTASITGNLFNGSSGQTLPEEKTIGSSKCVAGSSTGLEWFLCPLTTAISKAVDTFNGIISDQLNFNIDQNLNDGKAVHKAWTIFKNLITAALVIIMLAMVFSQAIGGGPFEAYTVKKILPRLVIAVIAMQLSWELGKLAIMFANDLGNGLKQLMVAPFGGGGNMDLNSILHHMDGTWALATQAIIPALLFGTVILGFVALPGTFVLAFSLFIGVFMTFAMLLFRNVLIVALVIFSPLAILTWILPNQSMQKLWKTWSDNFIKLLLLFPLMIAIIYTGRIFAWIIADTNQGDSVAHLNFIDLFGILIAYFGPYFIIFKAYQWGGGIYSLAGQSMSRAKGTAVKATSPYLEKLAGRAQGNIANRYSLAGKDLRNARDEHQTTLGKIENANKRIQDAQRRGEDTTNLEAYLAKQQAKAAQQAPEVERLRRQGRLNRGLLAIGSGKPLPTSRQQVERIARGDEYQTELVGLKKALIHHDYVEQLNSGVSVQKAKRRMQSKYGIQNYEKQPDGSDKVKDKYTARALNEWFVDTKSALEFGDEGFRLGAIKNSKGQVIGYESDPSITPEMAARGIKPTLDTFKTPEAIAMMNADPNRFAYIQQNVPELVPFNQALGGGPKKEDYLPGGAKFSQSDAVTPADYMPGGRHYSAADNPANNPDLAAILARAHTEKVAEAQAENARHLKILNNMEHTSDLATWRPEQIQLMKDNVKRMKDLGMDSSFQQEFQRIMGELKASKSPEDMGTLSRLKGGAKSARSHVNELMEDQRWLEDTLDVPVVTSSGVHRRAALPREEDIRDDADVRAELIRNVVAGPQDPADPRKPNKVFQEIAQTIAETPDYADEAHRTESNVYWDVVRDTRNKVRATRDPATRENFNELLEQARKDAEAHARSTIQRAISEEMPAPELRRLEVNERQRVEALTRLLNEMKFAVPKANQYAAPIGPVPGPGGPPPPPVPPVPPPPVPPPPPPPPPPVPPVPPPPPPPVPPVPPIPTPTPVPTPNQYPGPIGPQGPAVEPGTLIVPHETPPGGGPVIIA